MNLFRAICYEFASPNCSVSVLKYISLLKPIPLVYGILQLDYGCYIGE